MRERFSVTVLGSVHFTGVCLSCGGWVKGKEEVALKPRKLEQADQHRPSCFSKPSGTASNTRLQSSDS